ncbi:hypothetical protein TNCT_540101 [Trichonephila clavata]|uniref:Uncharacterized protein n=1 Tax=Trichonephila clavata TaxID=2740835 RepID=A0A8X6HSX7_TRICU|nr:hypothetical protein TNCT_540101 [Trichonephila clavata]
MQQLNHKPVFSYGGRHVQDLLDTKTGAAKGKKSVLVPISTNFMSFTSRMTLPAVKNFSKLRSGTLARMRKSTQF